jgi:PAS domain-containing protein
MYEMLKETYPQVDQGTRAWNPEEGAKRYADLILEMTKYLGTRDAFKDTSIGGHMAQLDKTFPTLDCASCIFTPKTVEVARNKNIELFVCSEVVDVKGHVGNFTVTIKKQPTYVDFNRCTGCGDCVEACVLKKGVPSEHEGSHTREGKVRVERVVKAPVKDVSGETAGIMGIFWDVTDLRAREEELEKKFAELTRHLDARNDELREIQGKFQAQQAECRRLEEKVINLEGLYGILFENTGTAVAVVEDNQIVSRVNSEFERFSGY